MPAFSASNLILLHLHAANKLDQFIGQMRVENEHFKTAVLQEIRTALRGVVSLPPPPASDLSAGPAKKRSSKHKRKHEDADDSSASSSSALRAGEKKEDAQASSQQVFFLSLSFRLPWRLIVIPNFFLTSFFPPSFQISLISFSDTVSVLHPVNLTVMGFFFGLLHIV